MFWLDFFALLGFALLFLPVFLVGLKAVGAVTLRWEPIALICLTSVLLGIGLMQMAASISAAV